MLRPALAIGIPAVAASCVAAGVATLAVSNDFAVWAVVTFTGVSLAAGLYVSWLLGRRGAPEVGDALGWGIASAIVAALAPLALFVVLFAALGGGK